MSQEGTKKLGVGSLTIVFVAFACSVTNVPNGAMIGQGTSFVKGFIGLIIGFVLIAVVASLVSFMGYKLGTTKEAIFKTVFGRRGFIICTVLYAFCQAFWACYDFFNAGQALYNLMPDGWVIKNIGFCIAIAVMLVVTIIGGVYGITGVKWISSITIPVAIIIFVVILVSCLRNAGGMAALVAYVPETETMGVLGATQIMFGMWMAAYIGMIDLTTDAKNGKAVVVASIGAGAFIMLCFFVGQVGYIGTGFKTLGDICLSLGGAIFFCGNIFVIFAQANTTPAAGYMYALSFSEVFRVARKKVAIIVPCLVAILAFVIMYGPGVDFINNITNVVSTLMGPIIGIFLAEFYIITKQKLVLKEEKELPGFCADAYCALIIGVVIAYILNQTSVLPLPAAWGIIVTLVLYLIFHRVFKKRNDGVQLAEGE